MKKISLFVIAALAMGLSQVNAITVFEDDFDGENSGNQSLTFTGFSNWNVTSGTVDLINGTSYLSPVIVGHGLLVDLDGSNNVAGKMVLKNALSLLAGSYTLSYELAGNHRVGSGRPLDDTANVLVETGIASAAHTLSQLDSFQMFTLNFVLAATTDVTISFEGLGGDNVGLLLDNVKLERREVADAGSTAGLFGLGFLGLLALRKRLK